MQSNEPDPTQLDDSGGVGQFKAFIAVFGSVGFFAASAALGWASFRHQLSHEPMPNGTGGTMSFGTGYLIALGFLMVSVVWFLAARKLLRHK